MEMLTTLLDILSKFSPLAVAALLAVVVFLLVWRSPIKPLETSLDDIRSNHLHMLPGIANNMEKAVEILQRIEVRLGEDLSYLKAKLDN